MCYGMRQILLTAIAVVFTFGVSFKLHSLNLPLIRLGYVPNKLNASTSLKASFLRNSTKPSRLPLASVLKKNEWDEKSDIKNEGDAARELALTSQAKKCPTLPAPPALPGKKGINERGLGKDCSLCHPPADLVTSHFISHARDFGCVGIMAANNAKLINRPPSRN